MHHEPAADTCAEEVEIIPPLDQFFAQPDGPVARLALFAGMGGTDDRTNAVAAAPVTRNHPQPLAGQPEENQGKNQMCNADRQGTEGMALTKENTPR